MGSPYSGNYHAASGKKILPLLKIKLEILKLTWTFEAHGLKPIHKR